jgi:hypothetical protein
MVISAFSHVLLEHNICIMAEAISDQSWNFTELDLFDNSDDSHDTDLQTSEAVVRVDSENNMEISEPRIDFIVDCITELLLHSIHHIFRNFQSFLVFVF